MKFRRIAHLLAKKPVNHRTTEGEDQAERDQHGEEGAKLNLKENLQHRKETGTFKRPLKCFNQMVDHARTSPGLISP